MRPTRPRRRERTCRARPASPGGPPAELGRTPAARKVKAVVRVLQGGDAPRRGRQPSFYRVARVAPIDFGGLPMRVACQGSCRPYKAGVTGSSPVVPICRSERRARAAGLDAWNRRDWEGGLVDMRPDIVWRTSGVIPDLEKAYTGHTACSSSGATGRRAGTRSRSSPRSSATSATTCWWSRISCGSRGEIKVDQPVAFIFRVEDGQLAEFQSYWNRDRSGPT